MRENRKTPQKDEVAWVTQVEKLQMQLEAVKRSHNTEMVNLRQTLTKQLWAAKDKERQLQEQIAKQTAETQLVAKNLSETKERLQRLSKLKCRDSLFMTKVLELEKYKERLVKAKKRFESEKGKLKREIQSLKNQNHVFCKNRDFVAKLEDCFIQKQQDRIEELEEMLQVQVACSEDAKTDLQYAANNLEDNTALKRNLETERRRSDDLQDRLQASEQKLKAYEESESPFKKEAERLRPLVKARDSKIQYLESYLKRFKDDVYQCMSARGNTRLFRDRYEKVKARYIECTEQGLPQYICASDFMQLELRMEHLKARISDCMKVIHRPKLLPQKVAALNEALEAKIPAISGITQELRKRENALQDTLRKVSQKLQKEQAKNQRLQNGAQDAQKKRRELMTQLAAQNEEVLHLKVELLKTENMLYKATKPAHQKVQSWFYKKVLKRPNFNKVGPSPASPSEDTDGSRGSPEEPLDSGESAGSRPQSPPDLGESPDEFGESGEDPGESGEDPGESSVDSGESSVDPAECSVDPVESPEDPRKSTVDPVESSVDPVESPVDPAEYSGFSSGFTRLVNRLGMAILVQPAEDLTPVDTGT